MAASERTALKAWAIFAILRGLDAGVAQLVERNLAKVEVASSRLVSRSKFLIAF